ncbi:PDZ domain-containing protein, partial [Acinetobacter baumannii]
VIRMMAPDSPAAKAGLKVDDRIIEVDGKPVQSFFDLTKSVRASVTADFRAIPVHLVVRRGDRTLGFTVVPEVTKEA